ncbi:unnamed protein product [Mucor hiemalis]
MFLNHILNVFNKKSKVERPAETPEVLSSSPPITEEDTLTTTINDETPPTSVVSNNANNRPTSTTTFSLPEVEFEESRNLLKLDFFSDSNEQRDKATTFPNFDYLLQDKQPKTQDGVTDVKKRKLSTTLRHRISLYKPNKTVKRTLSSPHLTQ